MQTKVTRTRLGVGLAVLHVDDAPPENRDDALRATAEHAEGCNHLHMPPADPNLYPALVLEACTKLEARRLQCLLCSGCSKRTDTVNLIKLRVHT